MELLGHIHNGVVVLDAGTSIPEGTRVTVSLVPSEPSRPAECCLTNEQIGQILDDEDIETMKRQWNVSS